MLTAEQQEQNIIDVLERLEIRKKRMLEQPQPTYKTIVGNIRDKY